MISAFLLDTWEARGQWADSFKVLKNKNKTSGDSFSISSAHTHVYYNLITW
jgi:hypothetical protein